MIASLNGLVLDVPDPDRLAPSSADPVRDA